MMNRTLSRKLLGSMCGISNPRLSFAQSAVNTVQREKELIKSRELEKDEPRPLYMDFQATTPMDPRVLDAMLPYQVNYYGNPHSRTHAYGWESESAMEKARKQVADLIGADPREIVFTSGATESNNMSIKGVARFYKAKKKHIVTTQTEHKCVLDSCRIMEAEGFDVTYLPVKNNGLIDLKAVGKIPINVNDWKVDLMSISGHKLYGPKGIGALYLRRRPRIRIEPLQSGGGQERGLRSGTVPTPLAVGLGAACEIAQQELEYDHKHVTVLANRLVQKIMAAIPDVVLNGDPDQRYPGCVNLSFAYVEGESLLMALKDVALSSGRFGIGRFTTEDEVDYTVEKCVQQVKRLREMSPLWEMVQEGIDIKSIKWTQH
ncbi:hypothetical protein cypCar_00002972 [Cyprinus carpio]|nr:hypothetical protein cypCar_00002972 [Cyprinus carpio]